MHKTSQQLGNRAQQNKMIKQEYGFSSLLNVRLINVLLASTSLVMGATGFSVIHAADQAPVQAPAAVQSVESIQSSSAPSSHMVDKGISTLFGAFVCAYGSVKFMSMAKGIKKQLNEMAPKVPEVKS